MDVKSAASLRLDILSNYSRRVWVRDLRHSSANSVTFFPADCARAGMTFLLRVFILEKQTPGRSGSVTFVLDNGDRLAEFQSSIHRLTGPLFEWLSILCLSCPRPYAVSMEHAFPGG